MIETIQVNCSDTNRAIGLWNILKTYGVFPIKSDSDGKAHLLILEGDIPKGVDLVKDLCNLGGNAIWIWPSHRAASAFGLDVFQVDMETILKPPKRLWFMQGRPAAVSRFGARRIGEGLVFRGNGIRPLLINTRGEYEAVAQHFDRGTIYWVGPNIVDEIVRYRQGDPDLPTPDIPYDIVECTCERPMYRYEPVISKRRALLPEADIWGWLLVHWIWNLMVGLKVMVWPLPWAEPIISLFTADGDEATKEQVLKMSSILRQAHIPWTLFVTPNTAKDESWQPNELNEKGDFGIHPVLYDNNPENYENTLKKQLKWFVEKFGYVPSAVRNHMFFHKGYLDLQEIWEKESLFINFNLPWCGEIEGKTYPTILGGSFHPVAYRRENGSWMAHMGHCSPYGDGLLFIDHNTVVGDPNKILKTMLRIIQNYFPGTIVSHFHPHNINVNIKQIQYYIGQLRHNRVISMKVSDWINFITARNSLCLIVQKEHLFLQISQPIEGVAIIVENGTLTKIDNDAFKIDKKPFPDYYGSNCRILRATKKIFDNQTIGWI